MTALCAPTRTMSPSRTVSSTPGIRRFAARRDDAAAVTLLEFLDAAGVVVMMVRHEDIGQGPAGRFSAASTGAGLRRIDRGGRAGGGIVQQHAEIVLEAHEEMDLCWHGIPCHCGAAAG